ncbi:MAG TPA: hypothetical protein VF042_13005 [Gemmatimonadaceae bacterium]
MSSVFCTIVAKRAIASVILLTASVGCADNTPARIATSADTVTVNTTMLEPLDAHVVNEKGDVVPADVIRYSTTADSIVAIRDGTAVQCRNDGIAPVTLTSGKLTSTVLVRCAIIEKIVAEPYVCMRLGEPPAPLSVAAFDRQGGSIAAPRLLLLTDSSFVRIIDGKIVPLKAGDGDIGYTNGRRRAVTLLRVLDTARTSSSATQPRIIHARDRMFDPVCAGKPG